SKRLGYTVTDGEPYSPSNCNSTLNCVFPGGIIPASAFSAPAKGTMKFIPTPNTGIDQLSTAGFSRRTIDDKARPRLDILTQKFGNWFGYYYFDDATVNNPFGASVPGFPTVTPTRAQQGVLSNTKIFGPTMVNEFRVNFMRTATTTDQPQAGFGKIADFGFITGSGTLGIIPSGPPGFEAVPQIGFQNFSIGSPTLTTTQPNNTWHFADSLSKIHG